MSRQNKTDSHAQILLPSENLREDMAFFSSIGFRLDHIFPADNPAVAMMSGHDLHIALDKKANGPPPTIYILTDHPAQIANGQREFTAPNGTFFKVHPKSYHLNIPATRHTFEVRQLQDDEPWIIGRAGMLYHDLIPDRLGGSIIASHIRIPEGGPVPDMVHYHSIGFQLIFCYSGWVKLVYEDQGPPFILKAGDCVTQPPQIRHRVLEASTMLEVIEIGVPAEHLTTIDHEMELPTQQYRPEREFQGQKFCHHLSKEAIWTPWKIEGFEHRDTGISEATKGVASVQVVRRLPTAMNQQVVSHDADIFFTFVMQGEMELSASGYESQFLHKGAAYVIPPHLTHQISKCSDNLELLVVSLPGHFETTKHIDLIDSGKDYHLRRKPWRVYYEKLNEYFVEKPIEEDLASAPAALGPSSESKPKPSRNDLCPCGSGKKYKKCHWPQFG